MKRNRHKWDGVLGNHIDGGIQVCFKCECTRERVAGKVIYFINDSVYHSAPNCISTTTKK